MNREILFRGKRIDNGEWVYGSLIITPFDERLILAEGCDYFQERPVIVAPETVGQCTGLTDKNWKKIFEGDIVTAPALDFRKVEFVDNPYWCAFCVVAANDDCEYINEYSDIEVISNIHDNPELIGGVVNDEP